MRGSNVIGRFDPELEVKAIRKGMNQDLQVPVGQSILWMRFDPEETVTDDIYDVGSPSGGRVFMKPFVVPVVNAYVYQDELFDNDRGFYQVDTLRLWINFDDIVKILPDLETDPDTHLRDRVQFRGQRYTPNRVFPRGQVDYDYMVLMVDCTQVKAEEEVNDVYLPYEPDNKYVWPSA
jgi:hypothetical protein